MINLKEVGALGALPEDTSCEGYGVRTQENGRAGTRDLGGLGGDQKNQDYYL